MITTNGSLLVRNVQLEDMGEYQCVVDGVRLTRELVIEGGRGEEGEGRGGKERGGEGREGEGRRGEGRRGEGRGGGGEGREVCSCVLFYF